MSNKDFNLADEFEAYDKMWEWVDKSGKNISLNQAPATNPKTNGNQYYMWSVYIPNSLEYPKGNWTSADLNHRGEIEGVVFATEDLALDYGWNHLKELEDEDELGGFEPDDFTIEAIAVSGNKFGPYTDLIEWLDSKGNQVKSKLSESCKFDFTKEDLDAALDKLTDENELGLELGDNSEDADVMTVAGEPYGGTKWYVDKWAENLYIITSELWGQDGGGPEEGVYEELDSIEEVWDYLSKREQLTNIPNLKNLLTEWLDSNKKKITLTGRTGSWPLWQLDDPDSCEGCGCVVENIVNTSNFFGEPYILQNGHKLCSDCLEEWIKYPKGFIDKFLLLGSYNDIAGDIDDFIEHLKFQQQDIDLMVQEWNKRKKQNLLNLNPKEIDQAENNFINACTILHLSAQASDFI